MALIFFFSKIIICCFSVHLLISFRYICDFSFRLSTHWPCLGMPFGTCCLTLYDEMPMLIILITSKMDKLSTPLKLSASGTQSELWFVCESNSRLPIFDPMAPEPGIFLDFENFPCHFILIFLELKYDLSRGIRLGMTAMSKHDLTPRIWDWQEYA